MIDAFRFKQLLKNRKVIIAVASVLGVVFFVSICSHLRKRFINNRYREAFDYVEKSESVDAAISRLQRVLSKYPNVSASAYARNLLSTKQKEQELVEEHQRIQQLMAGVMVEAQKEQKNYRYKDAMERMMAVAKEYPEAARNTAFTNLLAELAIELNEQKEYKNKAETARAKRLALQASNEEARRSAANRTQQQYREKYSISPAADKICQELSKTPEDTVLLTELKKTIGEITDVDKKGRAIAIYYLGCLYTGQTDEVKTIGNYIGKNLSDHPYSQYIIGKYIRDACSSCREHGNVDVPCIHCQGNGKCYICGGSGTRNINRMEGGNQALQRISPTQDTRCSTCHGTGRCKNCGATGAIEKKCASCKGAGSKFSRKRVKETYIYLLTEKERKAEAEQKRQEAL